MRKLAAAMGVLGLLTGCGGHGAGARQAAGQRVSPESLTVAVDSDESAHDQVIEARLDRLENELTHQQVIDKARADALQAQIKGLKGMVAELMRRDTRAAGATGSAPAPQTP